MYTCKGGEFISRQQEISTLFNSKKGVIDFEEKPY